MKVNCPAGVKLCLRRTSCSGLKHSSVLVCDRGKWFFVFSTPRGKFRSPWII